MYDTILIPTDGSSHVEPAIEYGLALAQRYDATVHALHVVDSSPIERKLDLTALELENETPPDSWYAAGDSATREVADRATEEGVEAVTEVHRGIPVREVASYIDRNDIDLVSMGTRGHTGLNRLLFGSVTARIVRTVDVPVLSVKSSELEHSSDAPRDPLFENILVPTDGSKQAQAAVDHGLDIARTYDATFHALHVLDRRAYASRPGNTWDDLREAMEDSGKTLLENVRSKAEQNEMTFVTDTRHGVPHQAIQEYIDERGIDLVVMGTHGRSGIERQIIGSVTERVLRSSSIPVLTIRGTWN